MGKTYVIEPMTIFSEVHDLVTQDAYENETTFTVDTKGMSEVVFLVKNTDAANTLTYEIWGSIDFGEEYDLVEKVAADVVKATQDLYRITGKYYSNILIKLKSKVVSTPATATLKVAGSMG